MALNAASANASTSNARFVLAPVVLAPEGYQPCAVFELRVVVPNAASFSPPESTQDFAPLEKVSGPLTRKAAEPGAPDTLLYQVRALTTPDTLRFRLGYLLKNAKGEYVPTRAAEVRLSLISALTEQERAALKAGESVPLRFDESEVPLPDRVDYGAMILQAGGVLAALIVAGFFFRGRILRFWAGYQARRRRRKYVVEFERKLESLSEPPTGAELRSLNDHWRARLEAVGATPPRKIAAYTAKEALASPELQALGDAKAFAALLEAEARAEFSAGTDSNSRAETAAAAETVLRLTEKLK